MARMEGKVAKTKKTAKGKKRKHVSDDGSEDEVPSKSVIVDEDAMRRIRGEKSKSKKKRQPAEQKQGGLDVKAEKPHTSEKSRTKDDEFPAEKNSSKRKSLSTKGSKSLEKRPKRTDVEQSDNDDSDNGDDDPSELRQPTAAELKASSQPDNTKAVVTVRQRKKARHEERLKTQKGQSHGKETHRNEVYLRKWKNERADWKFKKLRQISIEQSAFDEKLITAEVWPLALEYLSGAKGAVKQKITKLAEEAIDEMDKSCEDGKTDTEAVVNSSRYQRARHLLQSLD